MNKMNSVNQNINFPKKILNLGNRAIYFICAVFIIMVFSVIATVQSIPAKAESQPCFSSLNNQYSICYTEYIAPNSSSANTLAQKPVQVAQTPLNPNDFITAPPAQSSQSAKPVETPPEPVPVQVPTPAPVEKPKSVAAPISSSTPPSTTIESSSNPPSSSQSTPTQSEAQQSTPESKSDSPDQSTAEFGLGQAGAVSSISISKSAQATKGDNNWNTLFIKNWIYILAIIVALLFVILVFTIVRRFQNRSKPTTPINPTQFSTNYPIPDLNDLTYRLDNMPPEVEIDEISQFSNTFDTTNTTNIPTFDSDELGFGNSISEQATSNQPFEPMQAQFQQAPIQENTPTNSTGGTFTSIIQERLQQAKSQVLDPNKQALNNQLWAEYDYVISGKKSRPFPMTNKDRIFFAYCLAYMTAKVYVVDWDLWGE